jgi:hypothetical protein
MTTSATSRVAANAPTRIAALLWQQRAQSRGRCGRCGAPSRCRCGSDEASPGADVAGGAQSRCRCGRGSPVPVQMWPTASQSSGHCARVRARVHAELLVATPESDAQKSAGMIARIVAGMLACARKKCNMRRAACNIEQHTTDSTQHAACNTRQCSLTRGVPSTPFPPSPVTAAPALLNSRLPSRPRNAASHAPIRSRAATARPSHA